ncbi:ABC transporter ATP-binding protein [Pendulispora rubella]|uniref:ABC transporter ATP-binding protein n=1 Tax=Pendulispora rubella TaxID=2741070 RepID=A0ABZ2KVW2_9BACT
MTVPHPSPPPAGEGAKTLLEALNVTKCFGDTRALSGASLTLREGELLGLVGADGAGKTSLIRALVGLVAIDGGTVTVGGATWDGAGRDARESLGYMPQQYSLYPDLSVEENLTFFARLFGLKRHVFEERREQLLTMTLLDRARDRPAGKLSGGMYKKLAVACALLHRPRALVLDEPTNGVDPVSRRELWALLYEFVGQGMGVLIATPYMDEAARCGRVVLLSHGVVLAEGAPAALVASLEHVPGARHDFEDFYLSVVDSPSPSPLRGKSAAASDGPPAGGEGAPEVLP